MSDETIVLIYVCWALFFWSKIITNIHYLDEHIIMMEKLFALPHWNVDPRFKLPKVLWGLFFSYFSRSFSLYLASMNFCQLKSWHWLCFFINFNYIFQLDCFVVFNFVQRECKHQVPISFWCCCCCCGEHASAFNSCFKKFKNCFYIKISFSLIICSWIAWNCYHRKCFWFALAKVQRFYN